MRAALSLIEVLVVVAIILVILALLMPALAWVRDQARWVDCSNRVELLRQKLVRHEADDGGSMVAMLQEAAGIPGAIAVDFQINSPDPAQRGILVPTKGSFLTYDLPWQLRFPLGEPATGFWMDRPYRWDPKSGRHSNWDFYRAEAKAGLAAGLADFTAVHSPGLARALAVVEDEATWRSDRSPGRAWNDPWGNPLLLGIALSQYGPTTAAATARWPWVEQWPGGKFPGEQPAGSPGFSDQWRAVQERQGTVRKLYVAVAAIGTGGDAPVGSTWDDSAIAAAWQGVLAICDRDGAGDPLWVVDPAAAPPRNALADPPWQGLRRAGPRHRRSLLALPIVLE